MARDGTVTVKITGDSKGLSDALDDSDGHLNRFGGKMGGVAKGVGTAFVGMGTAALGFGVLSVKAFMDAEAVAAQTGAVIKSTGGVAKVTAGDVETLAGSLSKMSGVDDEAIASGQNLLLTFTKVRNETGKGNDIFNQATKAALDMSVAMGTDMSSASMLMGKALNDPIKGMTALTRSGVSFTQAQKDQVKAMVESGDTMGAQKLILKEMETQFGGSAKAAGETFAGQLNKLKVVAGNFMEDVGSKLVPILMKLGEWLGDNIPKAIDAARPTFEAIVGVIKGFVPVVQDVIDWIQDFVGKFRGGEGEIGESAGKLSKIVTQIKEVFESVFGAIKAVVEVQVAIIKDIWDRFGSTILEFIKGTWDAILEVFRGAFNIIGGLFDLIKAVLTGKWGEAWEAIKKILDGAWDLLFGVIRNALTNVIPTLFEAAKALLSAAFGLIWNTLKTILSDALDLIVKAVGEAVGGIIDFFVALPGRLVSAAGDLFGFVKEKITDAVLWIGEKELEVIRFFRDLPGKLAAAAGDLFKFVKDKITDAVLWIGEKELEVIGWFRDLPGKLATAAGDVFGFVKTKMTDAKDWVWNRLGDVVGFFTGMPGRITNAVAGMFDGIKGAFRAALNGVIGMWNDLRIPGFTFGGWDTPFGKTPSFTTPTINFPDISPLATGGIVTRPTLAMIGEAGPEAVIPLSRMSSGGTTVNHYEIVVTAIDPAAASEAVITAIKEYERRNGTDWRVA